MSDRDVELGSALRALRQPDHRPGFWEDLDERLAGEGTVDELRVRRERRFPPRGVWLLSAAAVVAMVVAAVALLPADEDTRVRVTPPAGPPQGTPQGPPWATLAGSPLSPRSGHVAVWTGRQMIVWGGAGADGEGLDDGASYDPSTDRWTAIAESPTGPLVGATAVWTGEVMLTWGAALPPSGGGDVRATGAAYDPSTDTWDAIPPSPLRTEAGHVAVWTGEAMLVWGGSVGELPLAEGASYDPSTGRWTQLAPAPIEPRFDHTAVWTGDRMIVWGGFSGEESDSRLAFADGAEYDPARDSWTALPPAPIAGRAGHTARWSGGSMVVWGGTTSTQGLVADGAAYDPGSRSWTTLAASPLTPRVSHTAVVADGTVVIWGGNEAQGDTTADGAVLTTSTRSWTRLPDSPLRGRARHSAVWTGTSMIVWGGLAGQAPLADGAVLRIARDAGPGPATSAPPIATATTLARPSTVPPPPTPCNDVVFTPDSEDMAGEVVAQGLPCAQAEAVVRILAAALGPVTGPARLERDGFTCVRTAQVEDPLPVARYECTSGDKRITFRRS